MSMLYKSFLDEVINGGIAGAREDYSDPNNPKHKMMLEGAIAGFEACRGKTPDELGALLKTAQEQSYEAFKRQDENYWKFRTQDAELFFVCNVVSAMLINEGQKPIVQPTTIGALRAAEILGVAKDKAVLEQVKTADAISATQPTSPMQPSIA